MSDQGATRLSGIPPRETLRAMSGLDFLTAIMEGRLPTPPMAETLHFRLAKVEHGAVTFRGQPGPLFYNPIGTVHGGYAATLLDSCMACAVHSTLPVGTGYTTLEIKVNLVRPITEATGPVDAGGKVIHVGRTTATAEGRLTDGQGKLLAHGTTTCAVFAI